MKEIEIWSTINQQGQGFTDAEMGGAARGLTRSWTEYKILNAWLNTFMSPNDNLMKRLISTINADKQFNSISVKDNDNVNGFYF